MERFFNFLLSIVLIIAIIFGIYFVSKYSYVDRVGISVYTEDKEYMVIDPYRYDVNKIKKYFMLSSTFFNHSKKYNKKVKCLYKVSINDNDIICYDGNKEGYAKYSKRIDTIDDVKEKVKKKNIEAVGENKYKTKVIKLNKDFTKMLVDLY